MPNSAALADMIRVPGKCIIGSTAFYPEEAPGAGRWRRTRWLKSHPIRLHIPASCPK